MHTQIHNYYDVSSVIPLSHILARAQNEFDLRCCSYPLDRFPPDNTGP